MNPNTTGAVGLYTLKLVQIMPDQGKFSWLEVLEPHKTYHIKEHMYSRGYTIELQEKPSNLKAVDFKSGCRTPKNKDQLYQ